MNPHDETYIGYAITDVSRLMRTVFERRVRATGLTRAQWLVIARLRRHPGLSQSEIADLLEIEKASAGRLIDRMQAKGWLQRRDDASDRRVNRLHLTPEAERLHAAIWPIAEATVDVALGDLSAEERRQLTKLMARVKSKLQAMAERDPAPANAGEEPADEEAHAL
jgi:MarR family transcriptional regulator for hemolysin